MDAVMLLGGRARVERLEPQDRTQGVPCEVQRRIITGLDEARLLLQAFHSQLR